MYSNCDTCSHKTSAGCATRPEIGVDKISLQDVCLSYAGKVEITEQVAKADNGKPKLTLVPRRFGNTEQRNIMILTTGRTSRRKDTAMLHTVTSWLIWKNRQELTKKADFLTYGI